MTRQPRETWLLLRFVREHAYLKGCAAFNGNDAALQPACPSAKCWALPSCCLCLCYLLVSSAAWAETSHRGPLSCPLLQARSTTVVCHICLCCPFAMLTPCLCCCMYIRDPSGCRGWSTPIGIPLLIFLCRPWSHYFTEFATRLYFFLFLIFNSYEGNEFFIYLFIFKDCSFSLSLSAWREPTITMCRGVPEGFEESNYSGFHTAALVSKHSSRCSVELI